MTAVTRPTMRDVAAAAGVSVKTVSRVVNREAAVAEATAARVGNAISTLGFRPNDVARSLRPGQTSSTLGLLIGDISNPFYAVLARSVEDVARDHNCMLVSASTDEDPGLEKSLIIALCQRRVDGLIVVPTGDDHRYLRTEIDAGTRFVFVDRPPRRLAVDSVVADNVGGARLAVEYLVGLGHDRVALVSDAPRLSTMAQRIDGFRRAMASANRKVDEKIVYTGAHTATQAEEAALRILGSRRPPRAVFATNNLMTLGVLRAVRKLGCEVAIAGFDDFEFSDVLPSRIAVVQNDAAVMGQEAARLLFARLAGDSRRPKARILPVRLVMRGG